MWLDLVVCVSQLAEMVEGSQFKNAMMEISTMEMDAMVSVKSKKNGNVLVVIFNNPASAQR